MNVYFLNNTKKQICHIVIEKKMKENVTDKKINTELCISALPPNEVNFQLMKISMQCGMTAVNHCLSIMNLPFEEHVVEFSPGYNRDTHPSILRNHNFVFHNFDFLPNYFIEMEEKLFNGYGHFHSFRQNLSIIFNTKIYWNFRIENVHRTRKN